MKSTNQNSSGTSFHGTTVAATVTELKQIMGEPAWECNDGSDKTNYDWTMETNDGEVFTVYDWKYYRPLREDEIVNWHIGGFNGRDTIKAADEIIYALNQL